LENSIRLLLLEDVDADVALIRTELAKSGTPFDFRQAATRDSFLRELDEFKPHLVLSDYAVEAWDGRAALEAVREKRPDVPFIFVSWDIHEDSLFEAMQKGATDYVFKNQLSRLTFSVFRALREARERVELIQTHQQVNDQERLRALGQMASGISHDFSNALTPVLGFTEILLNHPEFLDDKNLLNEYLQIMNTAARDAMNIVGRLRDFYRKRQKIETFLPLDLRQIVEQAVLLTRPKWKNQALANGAIIRVETDLQDLPKIAGDDTSLREVLTNLIFNAVDAMPRGGVLTFTGTAEGDTVKLEIADSGQGMPEEVRQRCFEPFFSTKGKAGTGLGLSMVYGVVKRHDGQIDVRSEPGKGTTFVITFPAYAPAPAARTAEAPRESGVLHARSLDVLIVDDEPMVREVMKQYFMGDGHRAETAVDAAEGLDRFKSGKFDLVVTDWAMPGAPVEGMTAEIKRLSPRTPVIVLTGFGEMIRARGAGAHGVDCILSKPPTLLSVREAVASVLSKYEPA